jgi:hypothetical protein
MKVTATSAVKLDPTQGRANGYRQSLIILFVDGDQGIQSFSESTHFPLSDARSEQTASWSVPDKTIVAILVAKCSFTTDQKPMGLQKGMGMSVLKVVHMGG